MKTFEFERLVNECIWRDQLSRIDVLIPKGYQSPGYEHFENDCFVIRPYDWNEPEEPLPNFEHKPSGFKLWWYKYPMRSAECNMEITHEQFFDILVDCRNSFESHRVYAYNDEWWKENKENE